MKKILIISSVLFPLIIGCETIVDIDIPFEPPSLVINCTLSDKEYITAHISQSLHILESGDYKTVSGATVEIYEDGNLLEALPDSLDGYYKSGLNKPKRGKSYEIKVSKTGYETASSTVALPLDTANILSVKIDTLIENDLGYTSAYLRFSVEINDDKAYDNYYVVSIYRGYYYYEYDFSVDPPLLIDSVYTLNKEYIQSRDPSLEDFQSYGQDILFNDELFNGKTYNMNVLMSFYYDPEYPDQNEYDYWVFLGNTSESYYLYEISSQLQYWTGDNPLAQPVVVYNNIENGFGIFGAYNTAVYKVK